MVTPVAAPAAGAGLLEKLLATVRPQFRVDVLVPSADDPVLGVPGCAVATCDYPVADHGICNGHRLRWRERGMPALAEFLADPGPPVRGRAALSHCAVRGCRYRAAGQGLCHRHRKRWERAGKPDPARWAATVPTVEASGRIECRLPFCGLWIENPRAVFCRSHTLRWQRAGRPEIEEFIAECARLGNAHIDLRGLPAQVKLELQYALQIRGDTMTSRISPQVISIAVGWVARAGITSLLECPEQPCGSHQPAGGPGRGGGKYGRARAFLSFAREAVETLRDGIGWDIEYRKDRWRLAKLPGLVLTAGQTRDHAQLRFDRITQPWLRELSKRWIRLRLISGLNVETVVGHLQALTRFSQFLATATDTIAVGEIDRALLERFLGWLAAQPSGPVTKSRHIGGIQLFFEAIRRHRWDQRLPTTAVFFAEDYPKRPPRMTRHLTEDVMNQIEQPTNLDRWPSPEGRLVTIILIHCGLRISDACTLPFDCLLHDGHGAPYLRYRNNKMHREAAVPIDEQLEHEIRAQQDHVLRRWPDGSPHLFPRPTSNPRGDKPLAASTYRATLRRWLRRCDICDSHGQPVQLTPHQWRHTFACRLINRDVPRRSSVSCSTTTRTR